MSSKAIVLFALLAVAFAERPYLGLRVPFLPGPQVVGGSDAQQGQYPFIVSLQWLGSHFCAGSVYNSQWILTAGHCVKAVPVIGSSFFVVKAGKHQINVKESTEQTVQVEKAFVHEQYQGGVGPYDIGLLKLKSPLVLNKNVQAIALPEAENDPVGDATLCGWGSTSPSRIPSMPNILQHVKMNFVDRDTCHKNVEDLTGSSPVHETNVCTGPLLGGISACSGDSGGPLIKQTGNKVVIAGVVSWGIIPCGTVGAPSVYARVSKFNSWIEQKVAAN